MAKVPGIDQGVLRKAREQAGATTMVDGRDPVMESDMTAEKGNQPWAKRAMEHRMPKVNEKASGYRIVSNAKKAEKQKLGK